MVICMLNSPQPSAAAVWLTWHAAHVHEGHGTQQWLAVRMPAMQVHPAGAPSTESRSSNALALLFEQPTALLC
jgi:hypothetical protein